MTRTFATFFALLVASPVAVVCGQTSGDASRMCIAAASGASVLHQTSSIAAGEVSMRVMGRIAVFAEAGRIGNAATSELDTRATTIAQLVGLTAGTAYRVTYGDAGVLLRLPSLSRIGHTLPQDSALVACARKPRFRQMAPL